MFKLLIREKRRSILPFMPKKAGLIIGVTVIFVVLAAFFMIQKSNPATSTQTADSAKKESGESLGDFAKGSIASLLSAGKNVTCSMKYPDGNGSGTVYVSGKKMRGEFTVMAEAPKEYKSSMIQDGDYAYMWSDVDKKGTKFKVSGIPTPSPTTTTKTEAVDINQEVDLKCSAWNVDPSMFVVPADIEFMDMSAMMEKVQEQSGMMRDSQKSSCDAIADPQAKAACQSALGN